MKKQLPFRIIQIINIAPLRNHRSMIAPCLVALTILGYSFMQLTYRADLPTLPDFVFVSRPIADYGSFYVQRHRYMPREDGSGDTVAMPKGMPGIGGHSRFRVSPGGKLIIRKSNGTFKVLIDGSKPGKRPDGLGDLPFKLVDVNAPDVSYDATQIIFAGALEGTYESLTYNPSQPTRSVEAKDPNAWRLYVINVDGTGLRQVTKSDRALNLSQFAGPYGDNKGFESYDDTDPAWLPDGRIVFSSSRFPAYSHYTGVRTTHLYVVNADGTNLHRITTERNSADRPVVDPLTGRIVFSRWWRNQHYPYDDISTDKLYDRTSNPDVNSPVVAGFDIHEGVTGSINLSTENSTSGNPKKLPDHNMFRNAWQLQAVNPDGSNLAMFSGYFRDEEFSHAYGGSFDNQGNFVANYYPMANMTEAAGFGGIRRFKRGPALPEHLIGVTKLLLGSEMTYRDTVNRNGSNVEVIRGIQRVYKSDYASDPLILPDGKMVISWLPNNFRRMNQDYGLYWFDPANPTVTPILIFNNPGTAELRAKAIVARPKPPIIPDAVNPVENGLPPTNITDIDKDGTFVFEDLNVFFNAPVDVPIVSAPKVGDVKSIRFYANPQRHTIGSYPNLEWPIFLKELAIDDNGGVKDTESPANVQLFEQLRTPGGKVPLTGGPRPDGAAHVAGLNFGRPGQVVRCVGCHAGHSMIPVPSNLADQLYTNLAPGANVGFSSALVEGDGKNHADYRGSVVDRRLLTDAFNGKVWVSKQMTDPNGTEWVELTFDVPVRVREVKLYNFKIASSDRNSPDYPIPVKAMNISKATVKLFADLDPSKSPVASTAINGPLSTNATSVTFLNNHLVAGNFIAQRVRIELQGSGQLYHYTNVLGLGEIEVIAAANVKEDPLPVKLVNFEARAESQHVQLSWASAEEKNSDRFEIERSQTGKTWQKIGELASHGDSENLNVYRFTDASPVNGSNLYRLKMVDHDKSYSYSGIRKATIEAMDVEVNVFPNPASSQLLVSFNPQVLKATNISIINSGGQVLVKYKVSKGNGTFKFDSGSWPAGIYNLVVYTEKGQFAKKVLIKN